jgi:uncharacterized membrane protein YkvA (DUF1232 family)
MRRNGAAKDLEATPGQKRGSRHHHRLISGEPQERPRRGFEKGRRMLDRFKSSARAVKRDARALYLAARDPRVPWYAKALALAVAAYAASPIDLIPDFIPVIGYLDDLIVVPLGIGLVIRLIPPEIMAQHRALAAAAQDRPVSKAAAAVIIAIWISTIAVTAWLLYRWTTK